MRTPVWAECVFLFIGGASLLRHSSGYGSDNPHLRFFVTSTYFIGLEDVVNTRMMDAYVTFKELQTCREKDRTAVRRREKITAIE